MQLRLYYSNLTERRFLVSMHTQAYQHYCAVHERVYVYKRCICCLAHPVYVCKQDAQWNICLLSQATFIAQCCFLREAIKKQFVVF